VCIGNNQLYACMLSDNPNSPGSAACWAGNTVGDQVVGTCDASTAMLTRTIKLNDGTVGTYSPDIVGNGYYCCSPTQCSVPSAPMCDSTLWYCITTGMPGPSSFVCVIDSGNPFSMSECVSSTLTFAIYEPQCGNITSPIFSSSTTQASTTVTSSQMITSTMTTVGTMTSLDTTNLPVPGTSVPLTGTSGPGPSASPPSTQHATPEWVTPLWTTILGSVAAMAIAWLFRRFIWLRYCRGQPDD